MKAIWSLTLLIFASATPAAGKDLCFFIASPAPELREGVEGDINSLTWHFEVNGGFKVVRIPPLTHRGNWIEESFTSIVRSALIKEEPERVLVYYIGHGAMPRKLIGGAKKARGSCTKISPSRNQLLTVDAYEITESADSIIRKLSWGEKVSTTYVFNCCRIDRSQLVLGKCSQFGPGESMIIFAALPGTKAKNVDYPRDWWGASYFGVSICSAYERPVLYRKSELLSLLSTSDTFLDGVRLHYSNYDNSEIEVIGKRNFAFTAPLNPNSDKKRYEKWCDNNIFVVDDERISVLRQRAKKAVGGVLPNLAFSSDHSAWAQFQSSEMRPEAYLADLSHVIKEMGRFNGSSLEDLERYVEKVGSGFSGFDDLEVGLIFDLALPGFLKQLDAARIRDSESTHTHTPPNSLLPES